MVTACSLPKTTISAEGETEDSNIDLEVEKMVNVFLTQPVLVVVCHTWVTVGGVVPNDTNGKNRFSLSMLMQESQSLSQILRQKNQLYAALCYSSDCLFCYQED